MKISKEYPPNYKIISETFKLHKGIIFTYGDTIYNPDNGNIDKPLMEHEKIHLKQQGNEVDKWWIRYLADSDFRLSQELEAYQRQYRVAKEILSKGKLFNLLRFISNDLSGEMYGNIISFQEAMEAIKSNNKLSFNI